MKKKKLLFLCIFLLLILVIIWFIMQSRSTKALNRELYQSILDEYQEAAENQFDESFLDTAEFIFINEGISNFSGQDTCSVYYQFIDLDDNGTEELIVSITEDESDPNIIDIYGVDDGLTRLIEDESSVGYRSRYYLTTDNRIKNIASGGAQDTEIRYHEMNGESCSLDLKDSYLYDGTKGSPYSHVDSKGVSSEITAEEYAEYASNEDVDHDSTWTQLSTTE